MKFPIKDFFSKCVQIRSFLRIWSHLLKKSVMESLIFCEVIPKIDNWFLERMIVPHNSKYHVLFSTC